MTNIFTSTNNSISYRKWTVDISMSKNRSGMCSNHSKQRYEAVLSIRSIVWVTLQLFTLSVWYGWNSILHSSCHLLVMPVREAEAIWYYAHRDTSRWAPEDRFVFLLQAKAENTVLPACCCLVPTFWGAHISDSYRKTSIRSGLNDTAVSVTSQHHKPTRELTRACVVSCVPF